MESSLVYEPKPNVEFRRYQRGIMFPPTTALNETAARVFELIDGKTTTLAIAEKLASEFEVQTEICLPDVISLLKSLEDKGYVQRTVR